MKSYLDTIDTSAAESGSGWPETRARSVGGPWTLMVRNVFRQGTSNLLLGLLIAFGSLVLVFVSQFVEGVSRNFTRNLIDLASGDVYVSSKVERAVDRNVFGRTYEYFTLPAELCNVLTALPGFVSTDERLDFDAKIITERITLPYQVRAFNAHSEPALLANFTVVEGRMFAAGEYGVLLPVDFARRHGIAVGDHVRLLASTVSKQVNVLDYVVTGTFRTSNLSAAFQTSAYIDLSAARVLVDDPRALTRLNIHLAEGSDDTDFATTLTHLLRTHRVASNPQLDATPWTEGATSFVELTEAMQLGYAIIMILVTVMIAASLAFATMMAIAERTQEMAMLGALGAAPRNIRRMLVGESLVLAAGAAALGTACAGLLCLMTSRTGIPIAVEELRGFLGSARLYPAFQARGFATGLIAPVVVALGASYLIARRASRLPIAEPMAER